MTKNVAFSSCDGKHPMTAYVLRENIPNKVFVLRNFYLGPLHTGVAANWAI